MISPRNMKSINSLEVEKKEKKKAGLSSAVHRDQCQIVFSQLLLSLLRVNKGVDICAMIKSSSAARR